MQRVGNHPTLASLEELVPCAETRWTKHTVQLLHQSGKGKCARPGDPNPSAASTAAFPSYVCDGYANFHPRSTASPPANNIGGWTGARVPHSLDGSSCTRWTARNARVDVGRIQESSFVCAPRRWWGRNREASTFLEEGQVFEGGSRVLQVHVIPRRFWGASLSQFVECCGCAAWCRRPDWDVSSPNPIPSSRCTRSIAST
eukprot:scaffold44_cov339-Pavlova_lutheri.AAC.26